MKSFECISLHFFDPNQMIILIKYQKYMDCFVIQKGGTRMQVHTKRDMGGATL